MDKINNTGFSGDMLHGVIGTNEIISKLIEKVDELVEDSNKKTEQITELQDYISRHICKVGNSIINFR